MDAPWWLFPLMGSLLILVIPAIMVGVIKRQRNRPPTSASQESSDQLNTLARELVHEIRNPLNSVNLNLQLIEEDLGAIETREAAEALERTRRTRSEIARLNQILTDFQRFARLPPLTFRQCDLPALIEEVLEFTAPEAQSRNIEVVREMQALPPVALDSDQFKQALWNLIINATQAMKNGGRLTVRALALKGSVQIDVEDTGEGISPTIADRIFDLFVNTKEGGTGVGLAIVKRVIEGHGGTVAVASRPNEGATFSIVLPINRQ